LLLVLMLSFSFCIYLRYFKLKKPSFIYQGSYFLKSNQTQLTAINCDFT